MRNYAVRFSVDWTMHCFNFVTYLTPLFVFSHQQDSFGEYPNRMMHNKRQVFTYSAQLYQDQEILELLETFLYPAVLRMFVHDSCETLTCSQLHCTVQSKQKNAHECGKPSTIDTGDYYVTHALHTFETTCNVRVSNNFEFTFQLMTTGLLNTEGFQNLKHCIRSKGFSEHL